MILGQIQKTITETVKEITGLKIKPLDIELSHPENKKWGDYSSNIAMVIFSKIKTKNPKLAKFRKPLDLAQEIVKKIKNQKLKTKNFVAFSVAGAGFINISIKNEWFVKELRRALKKAKDYGKSDFFQSKKIMVEFGQPNTHKLFHLGHLRGIVLGESICRLLENQGAKVIRANYQGDVGLHVAKCLWGLGKLRVLTPSSVNTRSLHNLGKAYVKGSQAYETNSQAKKEILEINKKIYDRSDPEINKLWQKTREQSLAYFNRIYQRLDTKFDRLFFESEVSQKGKEIVLKNLKKGVFKSSRGAIIFPAEKYGLHNRVFITHEDNPTYEAKDIGLARLQLSEFGNLDRCVHIVASEQKEYFKVLFKALEIVFPQSKGKEFHLPFGLIRLKKGKMSSRLGNVVLGEDLLDEAKQKIKKEFPKLNQETLDIIGVGAVKYSFLKINPQSALTFDFQESISLQGNSGPYLQYTYARCKSVLNKAKSSLDSDSIQDIQPNSQEKDWLRTFYQFSEAVQKSAQQFSPNLLTNFLYDLAQKYNSFYNKHRILGLKDKNKENFRLAITQTTAEIIKRGLYLLGIESPEKM